MSNTYPDLNFSNFPDSIDVFKRWLDITAQDGPIVQQYIDAMNTGNVILANQLLSQIPSADQKIVMATDLNKLSQAMLALERFYKTDVQGFVNQKQREWQSIVNQFDYKNVWDSGASYLKSNMVSYTLSGEENIYLAIKDVPTGTLPTDTRYWRLITVRGQQGVSGIGAAYRYQWESGSIYRVNDAVTYDGALWFAVAPSQGIVPSQGSTQWVLIMALSATSYPIQDHQPTNQDVGDLWFNTSPIPTKYYYLEPLANPATPNDIASGKEAYNEMGSKIIGTGSLGAEPEWNSPTSAMIWN